MASAAQTFRFDDHKAVAKAAGALVSAGFPVEAQHIALDPEQSSTVESAAHPSMWERVRPVFQSRLQPSTSTLHLEEVSARLKRHDAVLTVQSGGQESLEVNSQADTTEQASAEFLTYSGVRDCSPGSI